MTQHGVTLMVIICFAALAVTAVLTGIIRRLALARGVLDVPNERSSHQVPTPRGGGAAVVLAVSIAAAILGVLHQLPANVVAVIDGGGLLVAVVGLLDDRRSLPVRVRLTAHFIAAVWAVALLGGLPPLSIAGHRVDLGWLGHVLAVLAVIWTLNLFNFMDGIDAIAGSEALFVALSGAVLGALAGSSTGIVTLAATLGAACTGFLLWNWPPARIFMGDVGSGYLGYLIAVFALASARADAASLWVWLILGGAFFVDATVTLVRRALRGESAHVAHRSHAYQWLARRWRSHLKVAVAFSLVNVLWLLPCAIFADLHPQWAFRMVGIALAPLTVVAFLAGSGRRESVSG